MRNRRGNFRGPPRGFPRGGFRGSFGGRNPQGNWPNISRSWQNPTNRFTQREPPGKKLVENEIGVTEYISDHQGFNGIIKSRYSDFQVSEINLQGVIAKLTDTVPPSPPKDAPIDEDEELLFTKYNAEILPNETWDRINKLVVGNGSEEAVEIDVTTASKQDRTKIHEAVKKAFGNRIVGSTVTVDDKKYVRFVKYKKGVRVDKRVKWVWPAEYVYFIVFKENCDTMDAAVRIAEGLRNYIKPSMVGYAGTKDRRAKTAQWCSLRKVAPAQIAASARGLRDVRVGNFSFHAQPLRLGMLRGNRFSIALRNVSAPEAAVSAACSSLQTRGFLNYYGLQRFGSTVLVPTYVVGRHLLRGEFHLAIDSVLAQNTPLSGHVAAARGAARGAAGWRATDAKLQHALEHNPNDLQSALQKIPRNTRLLYLHSYQSLVWNRCLSERVKRLGLTPAAGDLVLQDKGDVHYTEVDDENGDSDNEDTQTDQPSDNQNIEKQEEDLKDRTPKKEQAKVKVQVKVLTQEDVDSGSYSITDIILPLPGYDVEYPPNIIDYYEKLVTDDGLTLQLNKNKNKSYNLSGAYRHIVVRPAEFSFQLVRYSDPYADLIPSQLDQMEGRQVTGILPDGKYSALLLEFSLPPSSYATMALRELLKADTSSHAQAQGNDYHKQPAGQPGAAGQSDGTGQADAADQSSNKRSVDSDTDVGTSEKKQKVAE